LIIGRADGAYAIAEIKQRNFGRWRRTDAAVINIGASALVKPHGKRQIDAVRNNGYVASTGNSDLSALASGQRTVLIHIGHQ